MGSVLVIEDDQIFSETVVDLLTLAMDCQVDSSITGAQALVKVADRKYDLILLDWQLPDVSGYELLKKIKELRPDALVIMMTGMSDAQSLEAALDAGAEDVLKKPFAAPQLLERARIALSK